MDKNHMKAANISDLNHDFAVNKRESSLEVKIKETHIDCAMYNFKVMDLQTYEDLNDRKNLDDRMPTVKCLFTFNFPKIK